MTRTSAATAAAAPSALSLAAILSLGSSHPLLFFCAREKGRQKEGRPRAPLSLLLHPPSSLQGQRKNPSALSEHQRVTSQNIHTHLRPILEFPPPLPPPPPKPCAVEVASRNRQDSTLVGGTEAGSAPRVGPDPPPVRDPAATAESTALSKFQRVQAKTDRTTRLGWSPPCHRRE